MPDPERPPRKRRSDAAMSGLVATAVLLVMAALTTAFILIGG